MPEIASLSLTIDSTPAVDATNRMRAMAEQARAVEERTQAMQAQYEKLGRQLQDQATLQQRLQDQYRGGLTAVDQLVDRIGRMREAWGAFGGLFGQSEFSQAMQRLNAFAGQFGQSAAGLENFTRTARQFALDSRETVTALDRIRNALSGVGAESDRIRAQISGFGVSVSGRGADNADQVLRELVSQVRSMGSRRDVMEAVRSIQGVLGPLSPDSISSLSNPNYATDQQRHRSMMSGVYAREIALSDQETERRRQDREDFNGRLGQLRERYSYGIDGFFDFFRFGENRREEMARLSGYARNGFRTPYSETIAGMLESQANDYWDYWSSGRAASRFREDFLRFGDRMMGYTSDDARPPLSRAGVAVGTGLFGAMGGMAAGAATGAMFGMGGGPLGALIGGGLGLTAGLVAPGFFNASGALGLDLVRSIRGLPPLTRDQEDPGGRLIRGITTLPQISTGITNFVTSGMAHWNAEGEDGGFHWAPLSANADREAMLAGMVQNRRTPWEQQRAQSLLSRMARPTSENGFGIDQDIVRAFMGMTASQILERGRPFGQVYRMEGDQRVRVDAQLPPHVLDALKDEDDATYQNLRAMGAGQVEDQVGYLSGAASAMRGNTTTEGRLGAMMRSQFNESHRLMGPQSPTAQEQFRMLLAQGGLEHEMFVTQSTANRSRAAGVFDAARSGDNERIRLLQAQLELSRDIAAATERARDGDLSGLNAIRQRVQERVRESRLNDEEQARQTRATIQAGNQAGADFLDRRAGMGVGARWMEDARAAAAGSIIERSGDKAYTMLSPQEQRNYALDRLRTDDGLNRLVTDQIANQQRAGFLERQPGLQMDILGTSVGRTGFAAIDRQQRLQYEIMRLGLQGGIGDDERRMMEDLIRARFAGEGEGAFNGVLAQLMLSSQTARGGLGFLLTGRLPALAPPGPTTASGLTGNAAITSGAEWRPGGRNRNPNSSATGPLQITEGHWNRFAERLGLGRWNTLSEAQRSDPAAQQRIYDAWSAEVGPRFGRLLGHQPSAAEMYPGWLLGDAGYERLLTMRRDGAGGESALTAYAAALRRNNESMEDATGRARHAFAINSPILRPDQTVDQALSSINSYFLSRSGQASRAAIGGGAVPSANIPSIDALRSMSDDDVRRRLYGTSGLEARNFALNYGTQQGETDPTRLSAVEQGRMVSTAEQQLQSLAQSAAQARVQISDLGKESEAAARGPYAVGRAQLDRELGQRSIEVGDRATRLRAIGQGGLADRLVDADNYDATQRRTIYDRNAQRRLDDEMRATGRGLDDQRWTSDNIFLTRSERAVEMAVRQEQNRLSEQYGLTSGPKYDARIAQIRESARLGEFAREVDQVRDAFVGLGQSASVALEAAISRGANFREIMAQVFATFGSRMLSNVSGKVMDYAISAIGSGISGMLGGGATPSAPPPALARGGFIASFASGGAADDLAIFPLGSTAGGARGVKVLDGDISDGMINHPTTLQAGGHTVIAGEVGSEAALPLRRGPDGEPVVTANVNGRKVLLPVGRNQAGELGVMTGGISGGNSVMSVRRGANGQAELSTPNVSHARGGSARGTIGSTGSISAASRASGSSSINQSININLNGGVFSGGKQDDDGKSHEEMVAMLSRETARAVRQATDEALLDHMRTGGYLNQLYNESAR